MVTCKLVPLFGRTLFWTRVSEAPAIIMADDVVGMEDPSHTQSAPGLDAGSQSPVEDWDWTPTGDCLSPQR